MKDLILSIVQVIAGLIVMFSSWTLAQTRAGTPTLGLSYSPPPDAIFEFILVFLGLVIVACGYLQRRMHVKYINYR